MAFARPPPLFLLCLYVLVADQHGADRQKLSGAIQNDILKEYIARGTYIYPPRPAMRVITDLFAWAGAEVPEWNTINDFFEEIAKYRAARRLYAHIMRELFRAKLELSDS